MIGTRDYDYIETRLLAPAVPATEALTRLRETGQFDEAARLMAALQAFMDECRRVRTLLALGQQEGARR